MGIGLFRPSLYLYIRLKSDRLSESDLTDILSFLDWHKQNDIIYDKSQIQLFVDDKIQQESSASKRTALKQIKSVFSK